jgi:hypothetical protein
MTGRISIESVTSVSLQLWRGVGGIGGVAGLAALVSSQRNPIGLS